MYSVAETMQAFRAEVLRFKSLCKPLAPDTEVGALIHLEAAEGAASDANHKICAQVFRLAYALDHP